MFYRGGFGVPSMRGGVGCVYNGYMGDYGEHGCLLGKVVRNFITLDIVMGSNVLDMYFVCGVGNEFYNFLKEELVGVVPLGCGAAYGISYNIYVVEVVYKEIYVLA